MDRVPGTHRAWGWAGHRAGVEVVKMRQSLAHVGVRTPDLPAHSLVIIETTLSRFPVRSASVSFITFPSTTCTALHPWLWHYGLHTGNIVTATNIRTSLFSSLDCRPALLNTFILFVSQGSGSTVEHSCLQGRPRSDAYGWFKIVLPRRTTASYIYHL